MKSITRIANKLNVPCNDCTKCPAFEYDKDYWGEVTETCLIRRGWYFDNGCRLPLFLRKIMFWKWEFDTDRAGKRMEKEYQEELAQWEPED